MSPLDLILVPDRSRCDPRILPRGRSQRFGLVLDDICDIVTLVVENKLVAT